MPFVIQNLKEHLDLWSACSFVSMWDIPQAQRKLTRSLTIFRRQGVKEVPGSLARYKSKAPMLRFVKPIIEVLVEWRKPKWSPVDLIVPRKQQGQSSDYGVDFGPLRKMSRSFGFDTMFRSPVIT